MLSHITAALFESYKPISKSMPLSENKARKGTGKVVMVLS